MSRGLLIAIGLWLLLRVWRGRSHPHGEGLIVGFVAGLIPCPLTPSAMLFALARGVPEAGVVFAIAMMLGVLSTLAPVPFLTRFMRDRLVTFLSDHGPHCSISREGWTVCRASC